MAIIGLGRQAHTIDDEIRARDSASPPFSIAGACAESQRLDVVAGRAAFKITQGLGARGGRPTAAALAPLCHDPLHGTTT